MKNISLDIAMDIYLAIEHKILANIGSVVGDLHRIHVSQEGDIFEILFVVKFQ